MNTQADTTIPSHLQSGGWRDEWLGPYLDSPLVKSPPQPTTPQKATRLDQTEGPEIENFSFNDNPPASTFSYLFQSSLMLFKM